MHLCMYVCMYVCMCICSYFLQLLEQYTYDDVCKYFSPLQLVLQPPFSINYKGKKRPLHTIYMCACVRVCVCACVRVCVCVCVYVSMCV